jgi:hypothetical protein
VIFNNESAAGRDGINNNYIGLQADGDRQADKWTPLFAGTCVHAKNMTGSYVDLYASGIGNLASISWLTR